MASKSLGTAALACAIASLFVAGASVCRCGEAGVSTVNAAWSVFADSLRRGDYPAAYAMFSGPSKSVYAYREFVSEYGPLSRAREMLLSEPSSFTVNVLGDWAEIMFTVAAPVSMRELRIAMGMAKHGSDWELVAGRNEDNERNEAAARNVLRYLEETRAQPGGESELANTLASPPLAGDPSFYNYRFEMRHGAIEAIPENAGLRKFHVSGSGEVRTGGVDEVGLPAYREPAAPGIHPPTASDPPLGPVTVRANGSMPDLAEPPPPGTAVGGLGALPELAIPPPLSSPPGGGIGAPAGGFALPERIN
ncbi:MAG: hypothetical protein LBT97_08845 [Planctomycetota bacterium]|nr:hypothetical protein [Planctomycetota bacterium]